MGEFASFVRSAKNKIYNYSFPQVKIREATSNDPYGPNTNLLSEISCLSYDTMAFEDIMIILMRRVNDLGKNWRHVFKSLVVLEFICLTGSPKVYTYCQSNRQIIDSLRSFQFIDIENRDHGSTVREKAKAFLALLDNADLFKRERAAALKNLEQTSPLDYSNLKRSAEINMAHSSWTTGGSQGTRVGVQTPPQMMPQQPTNSRPVAQKSLNSEQTYAQSTRPTPTTAAQKQQKQVWKISDSMRSAVPGSTAEEEDQVKIAMEISQEEENIRRRASNNQSGGKTQLPRQPSIHNQPSREQVPETKGFDMDLMDALLKQPTSNSNPPLQQSLYDQSSYMDQLKQQQQQQQQSNTMGSNMVASLNPFTQQMPNQPQAQQLGTAVKEEQKVRKDSSVLLVERFLGDIGSNLLDGNLMASNNSNPFGPQDSKQVGKPMNDGKPVNFGSFAPPQQPNPFAMPLNQNPYGGQTMVPTMNPAFPMSNFNQPPAQQQYGQGMMGQPFINPMMQQPQQQYQGFPVVGQQGQPYGGFPNLQQPNPFGMVSNTPQQPLNNFGQPQYQQQQQQQQQQQPQNIYKDPFKF